MMNKVLVTGATGFIGFELSKLLSEEGLKPRLLVRRPMRGTLLGSLDAELVQGNLEDRASLAAAVKDVDTVIHLGARATFERFALVKPTILDGSRRLMEEAIKAGVSTFIYASSLLVYSSQEKPIDETTSAGTVIDYGMAKLSSEKLLQVMADKEGIAFGAVRLPHVYGACDLIFREIRKGRVINPGNGKNFYAHMHVLDAARVLYTAAQQRWTGILPVADDHPASWNEFFDVVHQGYPRFKVIRIPRWLAISGTFLLTETRRWQKRPSLETPDAIRAWTLNVPVKSGLLWNELGISPIYPSIHEGIPAVLDSAVSFRWIHPLDDCCPPHAQCAYDPVND